MDTGVKKVAPLMVQRLAEVPKVPHPYFIFLYERYEERRALAQVDADATGQPFKDPPFLDIYLDAEWKQLKKDAGGVAPPEWEAKREPFRAQWLEWCKRDEFWREEWRPRYEAAKRYYYRHRQAHPDVYYPPVKERRVKKARKEAGGD
jgi:hypothetical protein